MYINQIEKNVTQLSNNVSKKTFIYNFLLAYGLPKSTITLLRNGTRNLSKRNDQVILKKKIFFQEVLNKDPHDTFETVRAEKNTYNHQPRFVIVTDYKTLLAIDSKTQDQLDIQINEIDKDFVFFLPLAGMEKIEYKNENPADVKAAERMAKIYDEIFRNNEFETKEDLHSLNVFLSRLLFCFFAEDTGIFDEGIFTNSISSYTQEDGSDLNLFFGSLFEILNRSIIDRTTTPDYLNIFPYVNGGLFSKRYPLPIFSAKSRRMIIDSGKLNWSQINPDIFGSMMQAVVHTEQRSGLGIHYTSVPNIMKVIEPLFLDDIREDFQRNFNNINRLEKILSRLSNIRIFDPACGSGNFLIIAYKEIRKLEIEIFKQIGKISSQMSLPFSCIDLSQFYGIELDDFACEIAILSLWLAEHQMNIMFKDTFGHANPSLPLKNGGNVVCGNATRVDWETICPKNKNAEIFILGNPPYLGSRNQDVNHKNDMKQLFEENYKSLDYVTCWFLKACTYIKDTTAQVAFVSTNSICQGEQVALFWPLVLKHDVHIRFAHQSFKWTNNAKHNAGVICVIIGLSSNVKDECRIYKNNNYQIVKSINPYLTEGSNMYIARRSKPFNSSMPKIVYGNLLNDAGYLVLSEDEKNILVSYDKRSIKFIKNYVGSREFIRGEKRFCLYIPDEDIDIANSILPIKQRLDCVRKHREKSTEKSTREMARHPHRYYFMSHKNTNSFIIPRTSSERRDYIPIGFLTSQDIISDAAQAVYDAETWVFGIISSRMHMTWVRAVAGRLKSDYRYSSALCYNTFPILDLTMKQKETITFHVYDVLEEREKYSEKTIAELYDPDKMPEGLKKAHHNLDLAVEICYRSKAFDSDEERLAYLFKLYNEMTSKEK